MIGGMLAVFAAVFLTLGILAWHRRERMAAVALVALALASDGLAYALIYGPGA